ncbi:ABC transporter ATP-binding protein [Bacillus haynesii]|uniref:ABC transporter ATP-binding protein n=1 Tax=Bacillus haynesii TaxID=1925021 RepID=UPI0015944E31|nr:ABC transporter ATP-binding protein [Bacillus haynesii]NVB32471.1 ABC transporter ATP-binding protein [Bacillus licheniformis]MCY7778319.1 ABC transporter ATP-binding protein [Bacillus haynesii]MCY8224721.1 ABC transporter ATP-binding protein [Bacillus haynesii]MCY8669699.1 ABC transporter ATP-binding protein [Bacillus haynesii]MEC0669269.1 ABC transporter ATP-binding protein [Bacillus haynesii]
MNIENVSFKYKDKLILESINLKIEKGKVYGLLGPNGAGKSTLLKCILGIVKPYEGKITIKGETLESERSSYLKYIGYVPDAPFIYHYLTPREYLEFIADLQDVPYEIKNDRIDLLLRQFNLKDNENDMISTFSFGMKHKLSVAGAIIHEPEILILDEPLGAFDPPTTKMMKSFLKRYAEQGNTVIMSTHLVNIAQQLCDKVGILINGTLVKEYNHLTDIKDFEDLIIRDMDTILK